MSGTAGTAGVDADSDNVYYNAIISHDPKYGNGPSPATYQENRSTALLNKMEDFYFTVGRLVFPSATVPLFIASLETGTDYALNQTIYTFNLTYKTYSSGETPVIFTPVNKFATRPTGTVMTSLQSSNPYYYIYTFSEWILMMNTALTTAFNKLSTAAIDGGNPLPGGSVAPLFYYNPTLQTMILQCQTGIYDSTLPNPIGIWFNNYLAPIFTGFRFDRYTVNDTNGKDNLFIITNLVVNVSGANYQIQPYEFSAAYWSSVATLQIISTLPVQSENITPVNPDYQQSSLSPPMVQQLNPFSQIIEDIAIDYSAVQNFQGTFIYNKTDSWRMISVNSSGPLTQFNISLYFTTLDGQSHPLTLLPGTNCTLKIAFLKKSRFNTQSDKILKVENAILNKRA